MTIQHKRQGPESKARGEGGTGAGKKLERERE